MPENLMNSSHKTNEGMTFEKYIKTFGKCQYHRKYIARFEPDYNCVKCWDMWRAKQEEKNGR